MAPGMKPFQLLEINIISAQDLRPVGRKMHTYARAWVNPRRKLSSSVDTEGRNNPTWNDKFVFRVDEDFLLEDTSAVMIEIYAVHWFRHVLVGTVRMLVGNIFPPYVVSRRQNHIGMRFVALQVRQKSGQPQGILNIGVALLNGSMKSMPLYTLGSALGYRDLMEDQQLKQIRNQNNDNNNNQDSNLKPMLCRSKSERSERAAYGNCSPNSSVVAVPKGKLGDKEGSVISIKDFADTFNGMKRRGKASSVINGEELKGKKREKGDRGKTSSVVSDSVNSKGSLSFYKTEKPDLKNKETRNEDKNKKDDEKPVELSEMPTDKVSDEKPVTKFKLEPNVSTCKEKPPRPTIGKPILKQSGYEYSAPKGFSLPPQGKYWSGAAFKDSSILSISEVGPSASEVAAAMAERRYPLEDNQSSVLDGWSVDESLEGLKSKLERWRMELPPLYGNGFSSSPSSYRSSRTHRRRRRSDSGSGLFSCFGNICGYECQCVCGKPPPRKKHYNSRYSSSSVSPGRSSFL